MQELDEDAVGSLDEGDAETGPDGSWLPHKHHTMLPQCRRNLVQIVYRNRQMFKPQKGRIGELMALLEEPAR